jgi:acetyltransferase-like isoleucine patch superfamily enzyme
MTYELYSKVKRYLYGRCWRLLFGSGFKRFGHRALILYPLKVQGARYIELGDGAVVHDRGWLLATRIDNHHTPELIIDDGACVGHFAHIVCVRRVRIGKDVLLADRVYISDNVHSYEDITKPVIKQPVAFKGEAEIGDGSWLGENVCVVGARIGRHCIVGANSVVTSDIPDYSIAVGIPARVIKQFNQTTGRWEKVTSEKSGDFPAALETAGPLAEKGRR